MKIAVVLAEVPAADIEVMCLDIGDRHIVGAVLGENDLDIIILIPGCLQLLRRNLQMDGLHHTTGIGNRAKTHQL